VCVHAPARVSVCSKRKPFHLEMEALGCWTDKDLKLLAPPPAPPGTSNDY